MYMFGKKIQLMARVAFLIVIIAGLYFLTTEKIIIGQNICDSDEQMSYIDLSKEKNMLPYKWKVMLKKTNNTIQFLLLARVNGKWSQVWFKKSWKNNSEQN